MTRLPAPCEDLLRRKPMPASDLRDDGLRHKRLLNNPRLEVLAEPPPPPSPTDNFQPMDRLHLRPKLMVKRRHKPISHSEIVTIADHGPQKKVRSKHRLRLGDRDAVRNGKVSNDPIFLLVTAGVLSVGLDLMKRLLRNASLGAIRLGLRWPDLSALQKFQQWSKLVDLVRRLDVNIFIDVGANNGRFARQLRKAGYRGLLISFEPNPTECNLARIAAKDDPAWLIEQCALGDYSEEKMVFHINAYEGETGMSSLLPLRTESRDNCTISVPVRQLDSILPEMIHGIASPRIFMKLDTQGFDVRAFDGARHYLPKVVGLQSELSVIPHYEGAPHFIEAIGHYEDAGFELLDLFPISRTRDGRIVEYDCLMAKSAFFPHIDARHW